MALFKISKGNSQNLPATLTEGYCWYTYDDSKFYIDYKDNDGKLTRKAINAQDAETLTGASLSTILNASDIEIPTSAAVLTAITNTLPLKVTLTDEGEGVVADTSFTEIFSAYNNGRTVYVMYRNGIYPLTLIRNEGAVFGLDDGVIHERIMCMSYGDVDSWRYIIEEAIASTHYFGGVKAEPKTDDYTVPVRIGNSGFLYVPAAPEQIQPDWSVNDESDPAYVKNRTHWSKISQVELLSDYQAEASSIGFAIKNQISAVVGRTYIINWNGTLYTCVAGTFDGLTIVGNAGQFGMNDTGEPFLIAFYPDYYVSALGYYAEILPLDGSTTCTISIIEQIEDVHKIDNKYLPDEVVAKYDWNAPEGEHGHILNRTHYTEEVLDEIIPETTVTFGDATKPGYDTGTATGSAAQIYPEKKEIFAIEWNGVKYYSEVRSYTKLDGSFGCGIGNTGMFGGASYAEYPFLIGFLTEADAAAAGHTYYVWVKDGSTTATFSAYKVGEAVHKLDAKYLPENVVTQEYVDDLVGDTSVSEQINSAAMNNQSDWSINDETSPSYVKNRTHWMSVEHKIWLDNEPLVFENFNGANIHQVAIDEQILSVGHTYFITIDDESYTCVAYEFDGMVCLGNLSIMDSSLANTNESFFMYSPLDDGVGGADGSFIVVATSLDGDSHTVALSADVTIYHKIDENYLPHVIGRPGERVGSEIFNDYNNNFAGGAYAHAEGYSTWASGYASHAEGELTKATFENAHAEGNETTASGSNSHAEGNKTTASNYNAHAEGNATVASGHSSHAEGIRTESSGQGSHAEGHDTKASAYSAHAEGYGTEAAAKSQHVSGEYNIVDKSSGAATRGKYIHIVGNGNSANARSNAYTLDWSGNAWFAGDIRVGGTSYGDAISLIPKRTSITLSAASWTGSSNPWSQVVTVNGVTANSKVDLQPTALQIVALQDAEITLMLQNDEGVVTAWAIGNKPTEDYEMQVLITEVVHV